MYNLDPEKDRNRHNSEMHFRLFHPKGELPTVVCMQDFDYRDYDYSRFMTYDGYPTEEEATAALDELMSRVIGRRISYDMQSQLYALPRIGVNYFIQMNVIVEVEKDV